jgi:outer membrane lipoprotein SlyB
MKINYTNTLILSTLVAVNIITWNSLAIAQPSATDCHNFATDYANRHSRGQVLKRGAIGAGAGALGGAIFGGAGTGAAIGGGVGAVSGGVRQVNDRDNLYQAAFDDCMRGIRP